MIEVSSAFVTRWLEEWDAAAAMAGDDTPSGYSRRCVELFLNNFGVEILNEAMRWLQRQAPAQLPAAEPVHSETLGDA